MTLPQRQGLTLAAEYLAREIPLGMEQSAFGSSLVAPSPVIGVGAEALVRLGIFASGARGGVYTRVVAREDLRPHLGRLSPVQADFDHTFQAFISHAAGHAETLPDTRAAFTLPETHRKIGVVLLRLGYLAEERHGVYWTEAVAPFMREAVLWDEKGQCLSEIWQAQEEAEARHFFAGLPDHLRVALQRTVIEQGSFEGLDMLRRHWTEQGWSEIRQDTPGDLLEAGFKVNYFTTLVRLIREGRG
ncbi:hypothetical protein [Pacificoceanicola onchidii]|uniref:hypothetical protein n=1 Tax=Pacificoceanicola onchidii TaxID=2562685 RepID=UPI0010A34257|nr:hypothetical protein [Pacificoceanicola onchidii]